MNDFFEDFGKKVSETADEVIQKTSEMIDIQKIKSQIRTLNRSSERNYKDIGKIIYEKFKENEIEDEAIIGLCEVIEKNDEAVTQCEQDIAERKEY